MVNGGPTRLFTPALLFILAAHLGLSLWYSVSLPILEGEDEAAHYAYVRYLAHEHQLPPISLEIIQAYHPPLYYGLGALLTFWVSDSEKPAANPYWGYDTYRFGVDNKNQYVHAPAESFPYEGTSLAVHLIRWLSVLFGLGTVALVYITVRTAFPQRPNLALGATAFAAFLPAFLSSTSVVSNDSLANLLGALLIYLTVRGLRRGVSWRAALGLGCVGGLLLLNKLSTAFILGPALLVVAANGFPRKPVRTNLKAFWQRLLAAVIPIVLLPLPWFIRNLIVYGELTNVRELNRVLGVVRQTPLTLGQFFENVQVGFNRFWVEFGIGQITAPDWLYAGLGVLTLVAVAGWVWWLIEERVAPTLTNEDRQSLVALVVFAVLAVGAVVAYIFVNVHGAQTRLFTFPALPALAPLLVAGWAQWLPEHWRPKAVWGLAGGMGLLALAALFGVMQPAFNQPLLAVAEPLPVSAWPMPIRFGDSVELLGADVAPQRVSVGDELTTRLCWHTLAPTPIAWSLFVQLIDPSLNKIGERETYSGLGRLPSLFWQPMTRFCDEVHVRVKDWAGGPAYLPLIVGYFDQNGNLPAYSGSQKLDQVVVGRVAVPAQTALDTSGMTPTQLSLGDTVDLLGYQWLPPQNGGSTYALRLFWKARQLIPNDYVVFVHWLAADGSLIGQNDSVPRAGLYPTSAWLSDETIQDEHTLTLTGALEGQTHVEVGLYLPDSGERLGGAVLTLPGP